MKTRHFGRDRIELSGDRLTIVTPVDSRDMAGWEVRRYRAPVVRFDGRCWRIVERATEPGGGTRFELVAWAPHDGEVTGPDIDYSAESVALRDHALDLGRRRSRVTGVLGVVSPLTGFLPARVKDRLETVYGIDPVVSTGASVFIQFLIGLAMFALASIAMMVKAMGYRSGIPIGLVLAIAVVVLADATVRWTRLRAEQRPAPGFYEWLFRRRFP